MTRDNVDFHVAAQALPASTSQPPIPTPYQERLAHVAAQHVEVLEVVALYIEA